MRIGPERWFTCRLRLSERLQENASRVVSVLILGALGSIPLVLLTPPFQAPDEVQHFYRAYELSEFHFLAEVQDGASGATLPESLPVLVKSSVYTPDGIYYAATPAPLVESLKLASIPLNDSKRRFVAFPGSAFYCPLSYIPQVVGIEVGRLWGLGPLYLLYLGRLFNCLEALGLVGFAVYRMPVAAELVIVVALLPMSLFLYASLSPDATLIGWALVFTALSFSATACGHWKTWELVTAAAAASVFCSLKPPYVPLILAGLLPGLFQRSKAAAIVRSHVILLAVSLGVAAGWLFLARSSMTSPLIGAHPSTQINFVVHHPFLFIKALYRSLGPVDIFHRYLETIGWFGWLTVLLLPRVVYILPLASVVVALQLGIRRRAKQSILAALWHFGLALTVAFLILTSMYLMSTHVGQNAVVGVQGRYFIPILVLTGMAAIELVPNGRHPASTWCSLASLSALIVVEIVAMDTTIIRAFHVF
jgi:Predicted membrane protein (DUF2142)